MLLLNKAAENCHTNCRCLAGRKGPWTSCSFLGRNANLENYIGYYDTAARRISTDFMETENGRYHEKIIGIDIMYNLLYYFLMMHRTIANL